MDNQPSLDHHLVTFDPAEMVRYSTIVAEVQAEIDTQAPALRALIQPFFEVLIQGEFTQIVTLLPFWLSDLIPVSAEQAHHLARTHLYGWWYYAVQDQLLDGEAQAVAILGGHLALVKLIDGYCRLGLHEAPCWADFLALTVTSAEWYAQEWTSRFTELADLTAERLAPWTTELIIQRGAPFYFNTIAQLHLAGVAEQSPLSQAVLRALQLFSVARQLADDATDWQADFQAGHLNVVSASLLRRMYTLGLADSGSELDLERLSGYQISDEVFWAEIAATCLESSQQALDLLAPYGTSRLSTLVRQQIARHTTFWGALGVRRATWRRIFTLD